MSVAIERRWCDKWTAFWLSVMLPGAGQLAAGSWTCLIWFAIDGILVAGWPGNDESVLGVAAGALRIVLGVGLGLVSGEHAKRLLEPTRSAHGTCVRWSVANVPSVGRRLDVVASLDLDGSPEAVWREISNLERFLIIDPFHDRVVLMRPRPAAGVDLVLSHNAFGRRFARFGRIVQWRPGCGYTFSDLSAAGPRRGFPHVFIVSIEPRWSETRSSGESFHTRLTIRVRGRWTSPWVPVWLGRWWVWMVSREHARLLHKAL